MNWITIFGVVTIAIGTLLTYYGTSLSSSEDKTEITSKIDNFQKNLDRIKNEDLSDSAKKSAVEEIQNEFQSWADKFVKDKDEKKVLLDKSDVNLREKKIILNNQWRPYYVKTFDALAQMVKAYNKANGEIDVQLIENKILPNNIYEAYPTNFKMQVQFGKETFWNVWLRISDPITNDQLPTINVTLSNKLDRFITLSDLSFDLDVETKLIYVSTDKSFRKANFTKFYQFNQNGDELVNLLKQAFEYQILITSK